MRNGDSFSEHIYSNEESRTIASNSLIEIIKEYMQKNVYSTLTLKDICIHFMLGKSQLSKIFKDTTGKSPMEYYNNLKISESKKLIREERNSISEISDMLGYSSIHIFSRAFNHNYRLSR